MNEGEGMKEVKKAMLVLISAVCMCFAYTGCSEKKAPETVSFITSATFPKDISAGNPSPSLFPSWNNAEPNSFSRRFDLSRNLITFLEVTL